MAVIEVSCPGCKGLRVVKHGYSGEGKQRYRCLSEECKTNTFILDYSNNGSRSEVKDQIIDMTLNGSGIRDISRVLGISMNTVISEIKKKLRMSNS